MKVNYENMIDLVKSNEAFYSSTQELPYNDSNVQITTFTYRLAGYSDFTSSPYGLESRGIAFVNYGDGENPDWELVARPFKKFFNVDENESCKAEDLNKYLPDYVYDKLDGSIIMALKLRDGSVFMKSKTSVNSDQAKASDKIYETNPHIKEHTDLLLSMGFTPIYELVGPSNRIVLKYSKDELRFLGARHMITGELLHFNESDFPCVTSAEHKIISWDKMHKDRQDAKGIEGWVIRIKDELYKLKCVDYVKIHKLKDNLTNEKAFTSLVLDDSLDDLISVYSDDQDTLDEIEERQTEISHKYNHVIKVVEDYHGENKHLIRKDYAIKAKDVMPSKMSLCMQILDGKTPDYKGWYMKHMLKKDDKKDAK